MGAAQAGQFPMLASGLTNTLSGQQATTPDDQMVQQLFQQLIQQTQQQAPPHPYEPPPQASTPAALGSILLGSLGSALNWQRPDLAQRPVDELIAQKKELDQAHAENVQQLNDFENKRDIMMKQISLKRLDYAMQRAKQEDNQQAIAELQQAKAAMAKDLQDTKDKFAALQQDRKYQELLTNALTTLGQRFGLEKDLENWRISGGFDPKGGWPPRAPGNGGGGGGTDQNGVPQDLKAFRTEEGKIGLKAKNVKGPSKGILGIGARQGYKYQPQTTSDYATLYVTSLQSQDPKVKSLAAKKLGPLLRDNEGIKNKADLYARLQQLGVDDADVATQAARAAGFLSAPAK